MIGYISFLLWTCVAAAAVLSAPTATATLRPALNRRAATTVGYYSTGSADGTTLWGTVTVETESQMIATSGSQFKVCPPGSCTFGICWSDTFIYGSSSTACGSASSLTCSSNLLYQDISDTAPLTNYFCDAETETGFVMYRVTPTGPNSVSARSTSSTASSAFNSRFSSASETSSITAPSSIGSTTGPLQTTGTSHPSTKRRKSTPIGAIVGGVVGGLALIGALIVAAIFLIRRKRATAYPAQPAHTMPGVQETKPYTGIAVAPPPEKLPGATIYPHGVQMGSASPPPLSPVPQYTANNGAVNELPAHRM